MDWFEISGSQITGIFISVLLIYVLLLIFIKINGLRSFSKMASHDFAVTIASGSILGTIVIQKEPSVLQGAFAIAVFFVLQSIYSLWRFRRHKPYIENQPLLLMDGPNILEENLRKAKITRGDLISKLREANVLNMEDVRAVVFEPTGDISVLHGEKELQKEILEGVMR